MFADYGRTGHVTIYDSVIDQPYDPGVGADLYITNGEFTDWAYYDLGIPAQTVELTDGFDFRFPDDEGMVQAVFNDNLEFALSYAESARDPSHPVSPVGITTEDVYHTQLTQSNGPTQIVEVLACKELNLTLYTVSTVAQSKPLVSAKNWAKHITTSPVPTTASTKR